MVCGASWLVNHIPRETVAAQIGESNVFRPGRGVVQDDPRPARCQHGEGFAGLVNDLALDHEVKLDLGLLEAHQIANPFGLLASLFNYAIGSDGAGR